MTTSEQRAEWARLAEEASPGPWDEGQGDGDWIVDSGPTFIASTQIDDDRGKNDAAFIAAAREAVPALLEENEALREGRETCYSDECGEPCRSWQAMHRAELSTAREQAGKAGERLGKARAEVRRLAAQVEAVRALADRWHGDKFADYFTREGD